MSQIAGKNIIREYEENRIVEFQTDKGLEKRRIKYHICVLEGGTIAAYKVFNSDTPIDEGK